MIEMWIIKQVYYTQRITPSLFDSRLDTSKMFNVKIVEKILIKIQDIPPPQNMTGARK